MPSALVTGGSSGIGLAIARMLREEGFALTLAARTVERLEAAAAELEAASFAVDVRDEGACAQLVASHLERHGGLDVLVNCAGVGIAGRIGDMSAKQFDLQQAVNLRGAFLVTRESLPALARVPWLRRQPRVDRGDDPHAGARELRRGEGRAHRADALPRPRGGGHRGPRDRDLPGLRRHADGGVDRHPRSGDDPARGLRGDRPRAAPPQPAMPASRSS